ncbi:MAG: thiamine-phosphate kinase, partial [Pirellulales bacterium]|nr:thiamine-phosphate kinase [Pirellulales bacterium]
MSGGEFDLIAWIRQHSTPAGIVRVGIGDDCAVLAPEGPGELLVTTDMLLDGRHFRLAEHDPADIARKALLVNLSDLAAMAGIPQAAVVAVALPIDAPGGPQRLGRALHAALAQAASEYSVVLAGGDTNAWRGPLVLSVTLIGQATPPGPVLRAGARPGDVLFVTGSLGGSLLGRHLRPSPRVAEGVALRRELGVQLHAMIDISDGLAVDLGHILAESGGLGATLEAEAIPTHR